MSEEEVEALVKDVDGKRVKAKRCKQNVLVGMCDSVLYYLNLVLEK